jgi:thiamine-monophosphate kinase
MNEGGGQVPALDPHTPVGHVGERSLLRHLRSRIPQGPGVVVGIGDDAACVETSPRTLVTTDCLVEGVHFRRAWTEPSLLGRKALTVNLSDIAAMAGVPRYATVSLCLPADLPLSFVDGFYDGLLERAAETGVDVVGGNLSAAESLIVVEVALLGRAERPLLRSGAQAGDLVAVTGTLGAAAAALHFLDRGVRWRGNGTLEGADSYGPDVRSCLIRCLGAHLDPAPPLAFGQALAEDDLVHAAADVSDGLSGDLLNLCLESGLSAWVDSSAIPVDPAAAQLEREGGENGFSLALHGGEDYEMLMAVPPENLEALQKVALVWDVPLTVIGEFTAGPPRVSVKFGDTLRRLKPQSHDHFVDPLREHRSDPSRGA